MTQLPFQKICDVVMKPVPATFSVKAAAPTTASSGESEEITGVGVKVVPLLQLIVTKIAKNAQKAIAARHKRINPSLLQISWDLKLFVIDSRESGKRDANTLLAKPPPQSDTRIHSTPARDTSTRIRPLNHWLAASKTLFNPPGKQNARTESYVTLWRLNPAGIFKQTPTSAPIPAHVVHSKCAVSRRKMAEGAI